MPNKLDFARMYINPNKTFYDRLKQLQRIYDKLFDKNYRRFETYSTIDDEMYENSLSRLKGEPTDPLLDKLSSVENALYDYIDMEKDGIGNSHKSCLNFKPASRCYNYLYGYMLDYYADKYLKNGVTPKKVMLDPVLYSDYEQPKVIRDFARKLMF